MAFAAALIALCVAVYVVRSWFDEPDAPKRIRPERATPSPFSEVAGHAPDPRVERWTEPTCWTELARTKNAPAAVKSPGADRR